MLYIQSRLRECLWLMNPKSWLGIIFLVVTLVFRIFVEAGWYANIFDLLVYVPGIGGALLLFLGAVEVA